MSKSDEPGWLLVRKQEKRVVALLIHKIISQPPLDAIAQNLYNSNMRSEKHVLRTLHALIAQRHTQGLSEWVRAHMRRLVQELLGEKVHPKKVPQWGLFSNCYARLDDASRVYCDTVLHNALTQLLQAHEIPVKCRMALVKKTILTGDPGTKYATMASLYDDVFTNESNVENPLPQEDADWWIVHLIALGPQPNDFLFHPRFATMWSVLATRLTNDKLFFVWEPIISALPKEHGLRRHMELEGCRHWYAPAYLAFTTDSYPHARWVWGANELDGAMDMRLRLQKHHEGLVQQPKWRTMDAGDARLVALAWAIGDPKRYHQITLDSPGYGVKNPWDVKFSETFRGAKSALSLLQAGLISASDFTSIMVQDLQNNTALYQNAVIAPESENLFE